MSEQNDEQIRVTDKRRIDPETYEVRESAAPAPSSDEELIAEAVDAAIVDADVTAVEGKVLELTDDLRRVHAEYANYRKRVERDRELVREQAVGSVLAALLPVLDDIERARQHGELEGAFKVVGENLEAVLTKIGLEQFGVVGEEFDPSFHEALTSETRDDVTGPTVVNVYQPGYRFADRVVRPARVAVADN